MFRAHRRSHCRCGSSLRSERVAAGPACWSSATSSRTGGGWIFLVSGFFEPLFYLLSIGLGLNHLVGHLAIGGRSIPYTDYVAPGLLASSAMNGAIFDATFGIFFKLKIAKTYDAVLATPLGVRDVAIGELSWALIRGTVYSIAFLVVMAASGWSPPGGLCSVCLPPCW